MFRNTPATCESSNPRGGRGGRERGREREREFDTGPRLLEHGVLVLNILFSKTVWAWLLSNPFFVTKVAPEPPPQRVLRWLKSTVTVTCPTRYPGPGRHSHGPGVSFQTLPLHILTVETRTFFPWELLILKSRPTSKHPFLPSSTS